MKREVTVIVPKDKSVFDFILELAKGVVNSEIFLHREVTKKLLQSAKALNKTNPIVYFWPKTKGMICLEKTTKDWYKLSWIKAGDFRVTLSEGETEEKIFLKKEE